MSLTMTVSEESAPRIKKGVELTLDIESAAFNGKSVARVNGMVVFLANCVPGDRVKARVIRKKKGYAEAMVLELLERGPNRVEPPCPYFGDCGGCKWQNLDYAAQLKWKRQHVRDAFERIGNLRDVEIRETVPCERDYWYRNKMEFSFGASRWLTSDEIASGQEFNTNFALGLHVPGRFDKVVDIEACLLQSQTSNQVLNQTREFALDHDLPPYTTRDHTGFLRNLVVRTSHASGEVMVTLITADDRPELMKQYSEALLASVPEVSTIINGIHGGKAQVAYTDEYSVLHGSGTITETVAGNSFEISPFSFFQTNSVQAEILYRHALEAAHLTGSDVVWDLYCGAGTISMAAARSSKHVIGVELNEAAVLDAKRNAERNGVSNVSFHAGDVRDSVKGVLDGSSDLPRPDTVIVDPPRAGLHKDVVASLLAIEPRRIAYVSCNPTTQARDCDLLGEEYRVEQVQPVDMFPQTYHIETVATLNLKQGAQT